MDAKEWAGYVQKVTTGAWPVPVEMIRDQNNWLCRSTVGRALCFKGELEDAMIVLQTVLTVEPDLAEAPAEGLSQAEHKVLCLRDIGEIIYRLTGQAQPALPYFQQALDLARRYPHPFHTGVRTSLPLRIRELEDAASAVGAACASVPHN